MQSRLTGKELLLVATHYNNKYYYRLQQQLPASPIEVVDVIDKSREIERMAVETVGNIVDENIELIENALSSLIEKQYNSSDEIILLTEFNVGFSGFDVSPIDRLISKIEQSGQVKFVKNQEDIHSLPSSLKPIKLHLIGTGGATYNGSLLPGMNLSDSKSAASQYNFYPNPGDLFLRHKFRPKTPQTPSRLRNLQASPDFSELSLSQLPSPTNISLHRAKTGSPVTESLLTPRYLSSPISINGLNSPLDDSRSDLSPLLTAQPNDPPATYEENNITSAVIQDQQLKINLEPPTLITKGFTSSIRPLPLRTESGHPLLPRFRSPLTPLQTNGPTLSVEANRKRSLSSTSTTESANNDENTVNQPENRKNKP